MDIITTTSGLYQYADNYPYTIAFVGLQRKNELSDFHEGHIQCITKAKEVADKVFVSFNNDTEIFSYLYSSWKLPPEPFDKTICLEWCENNNVDIVYFPDSGDELTWFSGYDKNDLLTWAINYCDDNNLAVESDLDQILLHSMMIMDRLRFDLGLGFYSYRVGSWKEGRVRLYHKFFVENNTFLNYNYILTPVLHDPTTNIPYCNAELMSKISDQSDLLSQIPQIIESNKQLIKNDVYKFKEEVITQINNLDPTKVFHVLKLNVLYNKPYVNANSVFIELLLYINNSFYSESIEGMFKYPLYIDL